MRGEGICLFGVGSWAQRAWLPALWPMIEAEEVRLTAVDLPLSVSEINPKNQWLELLVQQGKVAYLPWSRLPRLVGVDVVVIAAPARRHLEILSRVLSEARDLTWVLCEKPGGDSLPQFEDMLALCAQATVSLAVVDHYLLRPQVAAWRARPSSRNGLAAVRRIEAALLERNREGPDQDVNLDMLVHILNILRVLYPDSQFRAGAAWFARLAERPHVNVTHALVEGELDLGERRVPCLFEVGKSAPENRKELVLEMPDVVEKLDLAPGASWSYSGLLQEVVRGHPRAEDLLDLGGISANLVRCTWTELEAVRSVGRFVGEYAPGTRPRYPTSDR